MSPNQEKKQNMGSSRMLTMGRLLPWAAYQLSDAHGNLLVGTTWFN